MPAHSTPPEPTTALRVVVVTYNPGRTLDSFLDSLADATAAPVDVVAADNGSTDGAARQAAADGRLTLVETGGNLGYGTAANRGIAARTSTAAGSPSTSAGSSAPGDFVVVANPDITWSPGSLDALLAAATRFPRAGALGPAITTPAGERYPSARAFPSLGIGVGHAVFSRIWPSNPWTSAYHRGRSEPGEGPTDWLSGAALLLRREAFEAVGGFDERYFMFFEDVDLCRRLAEAGWERVYVPQATVVHIGGESWRGKASRTMVRAHHRSAARYLTSVYHRWYHWPLRVILRAGLGIRSLLARD